MSQKTKSRKTEVDWNIWHDTFMDAYNQIDFETCAKGILYFRKLAFKEDRDPEDQEQVDDMVDNLQETVQDNVRSAILQWTENRKKDPNMNPWMSETGFVRACVWGPESDEENQKAMVEIQILLHSTIH